MHIPHMADEPKTPLDRWMRLNERTDESLAAELKITRSQVNRVRNGMSDPSAATARALSKLTGIPFADLFQKDIVGKAAA